MDTDANRPLCRRKSICSQLGFPMYTATRRVWLFLEILRTRKQYFVVQLNAGLANLTVQRKVGLRTASLQTLRVTNIIVKVRFVCYQGNYSKLCPLLNEF